MPRMRARRVKSPLFDMLLTVAVAIGLALAVQLLLVKPYMIPSESMLPTLQVGERVIVDRVSGWLAEPELGQVTVFYPALIADTDACRSPRQGLGTRLPCAVPDRQRSQTPYVKRIVGLPGDRIAVRRGRVIRNGRPLHEPYVRPCADELCDMTEEITVPAGHYYLMGDNRGNSADSRVWGPVARDWIVGPARLTYWPLDRLRIY